VVVAVVVVIVAVVVPASVVDRVFVPKSSRGDSSTMCGTADDASTVPDNDSTGTKIA
jgi:hypothetical protein